MASQLLPKKGGVEFTDPEYWKKFFAERKTPFEWYGDFDALSDVIERYIKPSDKILQIGCGNSRLASQMYDNGFRAIHSIDNNAHVILEQRGRNKERTGLSFECTSATQIDIPDASVNVVIDKGTLDALMPPTADEPTKKVVEDMFNEVYRTLTPAGRYLIVTLAQEHILDYWVEKLRDRCLLRVQKVTNSASGFCMPVFVLVATKLMRPMTLPIEFCRGGDSKPEKVPSEDMLRGAIQAEQEFSQFVHLCSKKLDQEVTIAISGADGGPRYKIFIVDDPSCKNPATYAVFIVPIGRDGDWMFVTEKGRKALRTQCKFDRLAVVTLYRDVDYGSLDNIKDEMAPYALKWAPSQRTFKTGEIAYLSLGEVDVKKTIAGGESAINGKWTVEEVEIRNKFYRRLVFLASQNLVQSEAPLKAGKKGKKVIDLDELACEHHEMMLLSLSMHSLEPLLSPEKTEIRIAVLGLGGGLLAAYLLRQLPMSTVTGVELDDCVVKVAAAHFAFPATDPRMTVRVMDAVDFLQETAGKDETAKFDIMLVDLAGPMHDDGLSCPPAIFLSHPVLENMHKSLKENGILALNLVTRDSDISAQAKLTVGEHFPALFVASAEDDVNEVLLAPKIPLDNFNARKVAKSLDKNKPFLASIAQNLERMGKGSS